MNFITFIFKKKIGAIVERISLAPPLEQPQSDQK